MKTSILILTLTALITAGCRKPLAPAIPPDREPDTPATVLATPPPVIQPAATPVPLPPPELRRLAPAGVYFLLVPKSVVTDSGIQGFRPGTRVIDDNGAGRYRTREGQTMELSAGEITNDMETAEAVARADSQRQTAAQRAAIREAMVSTPAPAPPVRAAQAPVTVTVRPEPPRGLDAPAHSGRKAFSRRFSID